MSRRSPSAASPRRRVAGLGVGGGEEGVGWGGAEVVGAAKAIAKCGIPEKERAAPAVVPCSSAGAGWRRGRRQGPGRRRCGRGCRQAPRAGDGLALVAPPRSCTPSTRCHLQSFQGFRAPHLSHQPPPPPLSHLALPPCCSFSHLQSIKGFRAPYLSDKPEVRQVLFEEGFR